MDPRPSWDETYIKIAEQYAQMGTCYRRQVGCVLIDHRRRVLSMGMNGTPPGFPHCRQNELHRCPGAEAKSGTNLDMCWANHAEVNALLHCPDKMQIDTCYTTTSPCIGCVKALLHTTCRRIVFLEEYPQPEAQQLWTAGPVSIKIRTGHLLDSRTWEKFSYSGPEFRPTTKLLGSSKSREISD